MWKFSPARVYNSYLSSLFEIKVHEWWRKIEYLDCKVEYDDKEEMDWIRSGGLGCVRRVQMGLFRLIDNYMDCKIDEMSCYHCKVLNF